MKSGYIIGLVMLLGLAISGCATYGSRKCDTIETQIINLENRVNILEEKQSSFLGSFQSLDFAGQDYSKSNISAVSLTDKDIQIALKNAGFYDGAIDGKIGRNTRKAIEEFQRANNLKIDGIAGIKTRSLLIKYLTQGTK